MKAPVPQVLRIINNLALCLLTVGTLGAFPRPVEAEAIPLNDSNVSIAFDVDSTWHRVHGTATGLHGDLVPFFEHGQFAPRAEVHIPVRAMNTSACVK